MEALTILKELNSCFGPSGNEAEIANKIKALVKPFADEIKTDVMGNLIVHVKGEGPKLMYAAHMDSIGFIVTHIDSNGFLRVGVVGGIHPDTVIAEPVRFANGTLGVLQEDADAKKHEVDKLLIDIGASSKADAEKLVKLGDMAVFNTNAFVIGEDKVTSCYLDNRAGVCAQILAIERLKKAYYDTYFVFTVQEEVGLRGAKPAAFGIAPEYGIVVDTTIADDIPKSNHIGTSVLGGGAAIKVMDKSVICHPEMVEKLQALAKKKKIKAQLDVLRAGGTDGSEIRKSQNGVLTGGISVPTRYIHSPHEAASLKDIEACANLIAAFAETK